MKGLLLLLAISGTAAASSPTPFHLASLFTDNMVLQQRSEAPIWGAGTPGRTVFILTSWGERASTEVKNDGSWLVRVSTPSAGGPHYISFASASESVTLKNVMIGEVWLCSGQSNMAMPVQGWPPADTILGSAEAIKNSLQPEIRFFTVQRTFSPSPQGACEGRWVEASPATTPAFSATAYFFGKALHDSLRVPIGLIASSWGGTPVEAWTSMEYLSRFTEFDTTLARIRESRAGMVKLQEWLDHLPGISMKSRNGPEKWIGLDFQDTACVSPTFDDNAWEVMQLPTLWEQTPLGEFDGAVWFRKRVEIPLMWLHRDLRIELGPIDDMDITYINGRKVGGIEEEGKWNAVRSYSVPKELVDTTLLVVAVRVVDPMGGGGIYGEAGSLSLRMGEEKVSLAGGWKYRPVAEYRDERFYSFGVAPEVLKERPRLPIGLSATTPTTLFNGMIAPLLPFALRGVIWYQGESNVRGHASYARLFSAMIRNWRSEFRNPVMPFYFAQIAPYAPYEPLQSQFLREAQLRSLPVGQSGMVVTLDIGNPANIHPANKPEVGRRLALCALALTYGRRIPYSGPHYNSMKREGDRIVLSFDHSGEGLKLRKGGGGFQIAGADSMFVDAEVAVRGRQLVVWRKGIRKPLAVRYAFTNAPEATLFNAEGLPASSFRTDDWDR